MKNLKITGTLGISLSGILALGMVACQNSESLAGNAAMDPLASAKSKRGNSVLVDSLDCSSLILPGLAKQGADDSLSESHDSLKARGCEDHLKDRDQDDDEDEDDSIRKSASHVEQEKSHGGKNDSLKIDLDDDHEDDHEDDHGDREGDGKCHAKSDSTDSDSKDSLRT